MTTANASLFTQSISDHEKNFDSLRGIKYVNETWTVCLWFGAVYVVLVQYGKRYMEDKPRFNLRIPLTIWSSVLAVFSIAGTIRSAPELWYTITEHDFEYSVCNPDYFLKGPSAFWSFVMVYSKFMELGDTAFIVLRKQPLIFLHWYHHLTVLIYGTYSYGQLVATGRWYVVMNFAVHSFMYTYYTLKALRVQIPKWVSMFITTFQLLQMAVGIITNLAALYYLENGHKCRTTRSDVFIAFAMYLSYLCLFANFFYQSYLKKKNSSKDIKIQTNGVNGTNGKKYH